MPTTFVPKIARDEKESSIFLSYWGGHHNAIGIYNGEQESLDYAEIEPRSASITLLQV